MELAYEGESKKREAVTNNIVDTDDATTDFRFYAPRNPFAGAALGMSLYYYFDL